MKKKTLSFVLATAMCASLFVGCGKTQNEQPADGASVETSAEEAVAAAAETSAEDGELADGVYTATFNTDSSMFHVNEAYDGKGTLTVKDGKMTIHVSLPSKNTENLFLGTAEDAQKEGAELLQPTNDTVNYDDGTTDEVNGFDIPVPALNEEFDVALIGKKGKWYDHKVSVTDVTAQASDEDKTAADNVAGLIDAIYVQQWNEKTDEQCAEAKKAWDALTDSQKELVEGEEADPDYFGRDTGDASKDDALNADEIGEKEILVVSFGTSFNDSRIEDIGGVEKALVAAYPDYSVRRAFTSQIIINHVLARDGEAIDNMDQALERAVSNGVKELIVQPTHLMHGAEYDELMDALKKYDGKFTKVAVAEPLLGEVGKDATVINKDKEAVAKAVVAEAAKTAGFDSIDAAETDKTAFVFMGHGTSHTASVSYSQMQTQMEKLGYKNVFVGTVEGEPKETELNAVIEAVKAAGYKKVVLRPLMVVAGDHANNDMAGDDADSWKSGFVSSGAFDSVDCQVSGLGRIADVQKLYVEHTGAVIK